MLRHHFRLALRTWRRTPTSTLINVVGLALGLACCGLIALYVQDELRFDRHHEHADRVYRVTTPEHAMVPAATAVRLADAHPHLIDASARLWPLFAPAKLRHGDVVFVEADVAFAEAGVFDVFTLPFRHGDPATALSGPDAIVLSERAAVKYFGDAPALGRTLQFWGRTLEVTGVIETPSATTHYPLDLLVSFPTLQALFGTNLDGFDVYTYVRVPHPNDGAALSTALARLNATRPADASMLVAGKLTDIHLRASLPGNPRPGGNVRYLFLLGGVALLVLVLAGTNFVALATAQGDQRAAEIGVRKAMGAGRGQLARQFLFETGVLVGVALVVALVLMEMALPLFRSVTGKALAYDVVLRGPFVLALLGAGLAVTFVAGGYPALYLSRFQPVRVLKGRLPLRRSRLQRGLVAGQFALAFLLLISAFGVQRQVAFMLDKDLGFTPATVVALDGDRFPLMQQALRDVPGVAHVGGAPALPGEPLTETHLRAPGWAADSTAQVEYLSVTAGYPEAMGLRLLAGRTFAPDGQADDTALLLNVSAAHALGFADAATAVGETVEVLPDADTRQAWTVIGVVDDFNYYSLHQSVRPLVLHRAADPNLTFVRFAEGTPADLDALRATWHRVNPDAPFNPTFLDTHLARQYQAEQRLSRLISGFTFLAVVLALVGVFGLAATMATRRTKEIGVRRVLGAHTSGLLWLLTRPFLGLALAAFAVALPLAAWALSTWLGHFPYRIALTGQADLALWAGGVLLVTTALAVGGRTWRTVRAVPVDALRYE